MPELVIDVNDIEQLQMISNTNELDRLFTQAKSTVVQGGTVVLVRGKKNSEPEKFDELTTEDDLEKYRETVYKYL